MIDSANVDDHEGTYKCIASNVVGEDYRTMSVVVNGRFKPIIWKHNYLWL